MTKNELIVQCKAENAKMFSTINGEQIELTGTDYETACEAWAEMRLQQLAAESELAAQALAKIALLAKLGISDDEAKLLLS